MYAGRTYKVKQEVNLVCGVCNTSFKVSAHRAQKAKFCSQECAARGTVRAKFGPVRIKHGGVGTVEYSRWTAMKNRCNREELYIRRGIKVCERWISSFENFLADMGPMPTPQHSLDRYPDNYGNYEPGNCRWATKLEQYWSIKGVPHTPEHRAKQGRKGSASASSKLTEADVIKIRVLEGKVKRPVLAKYFSVRPDYVRDIQKYKCWTHAIPTPEDIANVDVRKSLVMYRR